MLRRAAHRVIGRADAHTGRNGAKLANLRIRHLAIMAKIGCIADRRIFDRGSFQNLTTRANLSLPQFHAWVNEGLSDFRPWCSHHGIPTEFRPKRRKEAVWSIGWVAGLSNRRMNS
jgi:hypothetical protein